MIDKTFKNLLHNAENYSIFKTGQQIMKGYKPDIVLKNGNDYIIMECDTGTSRKGYIGGMVKAAKFLTEEKQGILVLTIKKKKNTTFEQIHSHLEPYFNWIQPLTNLKAIYLLPIEIYCPQDTPLRLLDKEFIECSRVINRI